MTPEAPPSVALSAHPGQRSIGLLRAALLLVGVVVVAQAGLGFVGWLGAAPAVIAFIMVGLSIFTLAHRRRRDQRSGGAPFSAPPPGQPWTAVDAAGAIALVAALCERTWAGLHRTTFLYDVLSYHVHLPAAWRAAGRLKFVPTPFGDPAPAYTPSNAELVYHLGLAAAGNATLAHAGQIPFAALAALAIYATARVLGAARAVGFAAALAFLLVPEVWQQAPTAMADLALAALFLATIPFLLRLEHGRSWHDVIGLGLALGLLCGTKYVAVVMSLPIVLWAMIVLGRRRPGVHRGPAIATVVALVFACGGFWYLRNAILTGNPLYPATLHIGSLTLARGLFDGALIRTSEYHLPVGDLQALLEIFAESGWGLLGAFGVALGVALGVARRSRWPALALVISLLAWFVIPYQQSRFFFPLWGVAAILLAAASVAAPRLGAAVLAAATLGSILQFPTAGRVGLLGAAAAGAAFGPRLVAMGAQIRRRASPVAWFAAGCALAALTVIAAVTWARARTTPPPYEVGDHHDEGWAWIRAHASGARIAYTGSNLPLPLWGPRFENDVRYVNISGTSDAAPHDFAWPPTTVLPAMTTPTTAEPAPERQTPDQGAWLSNLDALGVQVVFVAALYPGVRRAMTHDQAGFPIERAWADSRPDRFSLAFANNAIRIYRCRTDGAQAARR